MSPTILTERGYRFFFFSLEERRIHVHVRAGGCEAKFWLEPAIRLARNYRFSQLQLREIRKIIEEHSDELRNAWEEYFGSRGH